MSTHQATPKSPWSVSPAANGEHLEPGRSPFPAELLVDSVRAATACQPVTVGIPLARGALKDANLLLTGPVGEPLDVQTLPLARWPDGSVKWLLLDFVLGAVPEGTSRCLLTSAAGPALREPGLLRVSEAGPAVAIETGAAAFHIDPTMLAPFARVTIGGREVLGPGASRVQLTDSRGRAGLPRIEHVAIEDRGPVRATVCLKGRFEGRVPARFTARLCFFAGTGLVRIRLTTHNPNRARHAGGLWDLGDPGSMLFRDLSLALGPMGFAGQRTSWRPEPDQPARLEEEGNFELYQDSSGGENWQSHNHVNRNGWVPCSFRGYRVQAGGREEQGLRASPVVAVEGLEGSVAAAIPEFWQQFPKAIQVRGGLLRLQLFPEQFHDLHELQGGEQKTHTVWLHFGPEEKDALAALDWVHHPARVRLAPEWYARSGVLPHLAPASPSPEFPLEPLLAEVVDGPRSFFAKREIIDEYGWRNYGEVYADHEANPAYCPAPPPVVTHYNNQFDVVLGLLRQFCRTGDARWFELLDPLARHVIDIDIYHTDQDKPAYNGGLFWFTDHYKDAGTCTHRTYSRVNRQPGDRCYGGGPDSQHNFATGLLHYYYLTGDPLARDAVTGLADWVVRMDDGRLTPVLGALDEGPTGLASHTAEPGYHGPGRGCGNSVNALLDGWLLTGQRCYLDKAEELIRRSVHPADDVAARGLLHAEKRWSYTVFLAALARYLDVKREAGERDSMYGYAQASLVRYAAWMLEHERPYLDHPEELEYPTETWAGQELRKANVLRLAAAHVDEPQRSRMLRRGQELADRAWSDLQRFESRHVARAVALLMIEGTRDAYFRARAPEPAPRSAAVCSFDAPQTFVSQKQRVAAQLRTVRGLGRALVRLASPRHWRKLWPR